MVVASGNSYRSCKNLDHFPHDLIELPTVVPPFYSAKDLRELRKLKLELLAKNSTSKASVYYTPPELQVDDDYSEDDAEARYQNVMATTGQYRRQMSSKNLQISPIHINYINDNFSQPTDEFDYLKIKPQFLLNATPASIVIELNDRGPQDNIPEFRVEGNSINTIDNIMY